MTSPSYRSYRHNLGYGVVLCPRRQRGYPARILLCEDPESSDFSTRKVGTGSTVFHDDAEAQAVVAPRLRGGSDKSLRFVP